MSQRRFMIILATVLLLAACSRTGPTRSVARSLGQGKIWTWVNLDANHKPTAVGLSFTESALTSLPGIDTRLTLPLPIRSSLLPYDHVMVNWNAQGQPGEPAYSTPHLDFDFYLVAETSHAGIKPGPDPVPVASKFRPGRYISAGVALPGEGVPWFDSVVHDSVGKPFATSFLYGYNRGRMIFLDPAMTVDYLMAKPNFSGVVQAPEEFPREGYYPTRYRVRYDPQTHEYAVELGDLLLRPGAETEQSDTLEPE